MATAAQISSLQYRIKTLENENKLLDISKTNEVAQLNKKYLNLHKQYQEVSTTQTFLYHENTKLQEKLKQLESQRSAENSAKEIQVKQLNLIIDQLKENTIGKDYEIDSLKNTNRTLVAKIGVFENDKKEFRQEVQGRLKVLLDENGQLLKQVNELKKILQNQQQNNGGNDSSANGSSGLSLEDVRVLNQNLTTQINENNQLKSQLLTKTLENSELKADAMLIKLFEEDKKSLQKRIDYFESTLSEQSLQLSDLISENEELKLDKQKFVALLDNFESDSTKPADEKYTTKPNSKLTAFVEQYNSASFNLKKLQSKVEFLNNELQTFKAINESQALRINELNVENNKLEKIHQSARQHSADLNNEKLLLSGQVHQLTKRIQSLEEFSRNLQRFQETHQNQSAPTAQEQPQLPEQQQEPQPTITKEELEAKTKQIEQLERALSAYETEIQNQNKTAAVHDLNKRKKLNDGQSSMSSAIDSDDALLNKYHDEILKLRKQLLDAEASVKLLASEIKVIQLRNKELQSYIEEETFSPKKLEKRKQERILQLFRNPTLDYQKIKTETLKALSKENTDLLRLIGELQEKEKSNTVKTAVKNSVLAGEQNTKMIPRSVLDRYMVEVNASEQELEKLNKKLDRLKKAYNKKSAEYLSTITLLFGYNIEFFENSKKIKIKSKFTKRKALQSSSSSSSSNTNGHNSSDMGTGGAGDYFAGANNSSNAKGDDDNENTTTEDHNYLVIDLYNKSLQISNEASEAFHQKCESLISYWVRAKGEIPCFLAALNLELFEGYDDDKHKSPGVVSGGDRGAAVDVATVST